MSEPIKIAYVIGEFPSVSETFILNQMVGMIERGLEIEIHAIKPMKKCPIHPLIDEYGLMDFVFFRRATPDSRSGVLLEGLLLMTRYFYRLFPLWHVILAGKQDPGSSLFSYLALADSLKKSKADVIHAQFGHAGKRVAAIKQAGLIKKPLLTSFRGGDTTIVLKKDTSAYQELYKIGMQFLTVSNKLRQMHVANGCPPSKIEVHHSGVMLDRFPFRPFHHFHQPLRFLAVGRFVEKKGHRYALEALCLLKNQGIEAYLRLIGGGSLEKNLKALAVSLGLNSRVKFAGWKSQDNVLECMYASDILLAPCVTAEDGDQEGIPNFVKEAMACGTPVVSTRHSGIPELIEDGVSGLLVPERNAEALAEAVLDLIKHQEKIPGMIQEARKKVEVEFDIEKLNDQLFSLYESIIII